MSKHTPTVSTDYSAVRNSPGMYWTRGVVPYPTTPERWVMVYVRRPHWTRESGKTHCLWFYSDLSGGREIEKGEWIAIHDPNNGDNA